MASCFREELDPWKIMVFIWWRLPCVLMVVLGGDFTWPNVHSRCCRVGFIHGVPVVSSGPGVQVHSLCPLSPSSVSSSDHQQRAAAVRRHHLQGLRLLLLQGEGESGDLWCPSPPPPRAPSQGPGVWSARVSPCVRSVCHRVSGCTCLSMCCLIVLNGTL